MRICWRTVGVRCPSVTHQELKISGVKTAARACDEETVEMRQDVGLAGRDVEGLLEREGCVTKVLHETR
jgi:hypothetical protein